MRGREVRSVREEEWEVIRDVRGRRGVGGGKECEREERSGRW